MFAAVQRKIERHDLAGPAPAASAATADGAPCAVPADRPSKGSACRRRWQAPSAPWRESCRQTKGSRPHRRSPPHRTDRLGEGAQHLDYLAPLGILQLFELVVDLDHLDRLDIERPARGRLVVDETLAICVYWPLRREFTGRPSRTDSTASASTIPACLARCNTCCNRLAACPSRSRMARRTCCNSGESAVLHLAAVVENSGRSPARFRERASRGGLNSQRARIACPAPPRMNSAIAPTVTSALRS